MSKKKEAETELAVLTARLLQKHLAGHGVSLREMNADAALLEEALKPFEITEQA